MAGNIKGITIEIDGNVTKLTKALRSVNDVSREVYREIRNIEKSLKFNPKSTELLTQKQRALGSAIENTKDKLKTLEEAQRQASKALAEGKIGQDEYDALRREIIKTENQLKSFEGQLKSMQSSWVQNGKALEDMGNKISKVGDKVGSVGKDLTKKVTAPITAMGVLSAKSAIDFESSMASVRKTIDMSNSEFEQMSQAIRNMAKEIPASTEEIAAVAEAAGQLGIEKENVIAFTRTMIDLGESTSLTADEAATAFARFANITQMPQDKFEQLGSTVVELGNNFAATEKEIVDMGLRLAATGSQIGLSEAETMGLATALSSVGVSAEAGGTAMSTVMTKINKAVGEGGQSLEDFAQVAGMTADEFASVWQADPATALVAVIQGLDDAQNSGENLDVILEALGITGIRETDTIKRLAGAADLLPDAFNMANESFKENIALSEEASQRYETTQSQIEILKNKAKDLGITFGNQLLPHIEKLVDWLGRLADKFGEIPPETQETILKVLALAAAIGPLLMIFGPLITIVGKVITGAGILAQAIGVVTTGAIVMSPAVTMVASVLTKLGAVFGIVKGFVVAFAGALNLPVVGFVAIVAGVTALAVAIYKNWDEIKLKTSEVWGSIKEFLGGIWEGITETWTAIWEGIATSLTDTWTSFIETVQPIWEGLVNVFQFIWELIKEVFNIAWIAISTPLILAWNTLVTVAETIFMILKGVFETIWNAISDAVTEIWNSITEFLIGIWNSILEFVTPIFEGIKNAISSAWEAVSSKTSEIWEGITTVISSVWNAIQSVITIAINSVKTVIDSVWNTIKSITSTIWNGIKTVIDGVWNGIKSSVTNAVNSVKSKVEGVWNSIKSTTTSAWNSIKSAIEGPINRARDAVSRAVDRMRSILNITLPFPKIKLPHFNISGGFSLNPPRVPHFSVNKLAPCYCEVA